MAQKKSGHASLGRLIASDLSSPIALAPDHQQVWHDADFLARTVLHREMASSCTHMSDVTGDAPGEEQSPAGLEPAILPPPADASSTGPQMFSEKDGNVDGIGHCQSSSFSRQIMDSPDPWPRVAAFDDSRIPHK